MAESKEDFLKKTLGGDLAEQEAERISDFLEKKFSGELKKSNLVEKPILRKKKKPNKWIKITVFILVLLIIAAIVGYFFFVSSTFAIKPYLDTPSLQKPDDFNEAHIKYIFNELGGYKLHTSPVDGSPAQIELKISDTGEVYTITAKNRRAIVAQGDAPNADIRIVTSLPVIMELFASQDMREKAIELFGQQRVNFGLLSSKQVLIIKGYQSVYEDITNSKLGILGFLHFTSEIKAALYMIIVLILSVFTIWYLVFK